MTAVNYEDYASLPGSGSAAKAQVPPELDFFHSVYISGKSRKISEEVMERSGLIQIRGVSYNHTELYMILTHIKDVLVNETQVNGKDALVCFSYREGEWPWYGTSLDNGKKRMCGKTSAERAANPFCSKCKAQIIIAGMLCDKNGVPQTNPETKAPIFGFIRGKGMKYSNVSGIVNSYVTMDVTPPIFDASTEEAKRIEKQIVNHKRFVTKITMGIAPSNFGDKDVFQFEIGSQIPTENTVKILEIAKKVNDKFLEKFDWSKGTSKATNSFASPEAAADQKFDTASSNSSPNNFESVKENEKPAPSSFSFNDLDDISF